MQPAPHSEVARLPLPPGGSGLPGLGHTLSFLRSPTEFYERMKAKHGPVFRSDMLGMKMVTVVGADANRWVFAGEGKYLENRWSPAVRKLLGPRCMAMLTGTDHRERRRLLAPHFRRAGLEPLVAPMVEATDRHLERWGRAAGPITMVEAMKSLAFEIAARYIFGDIDDLDLASLGADFDVWVDGLFSPLPVPVPFTSFGRAKAAGARLFAAVEQAVQRRAKSDVRGADVVSTMLGVRDDDDRALPLETIVDEVVLLLFAGHDTTVTSVTNVVFHLWQHPEVLQRARAEQASLPQADDLKTLRSMSYLDAVMCESMRVIPPIGAMFRVTLEDVTFDRFRIPKGWTVAVNPGQTHVDPELWAAPDAFEPDRFGTERTEHKRHPFAWIPFGGGPRQCLGQHFALLEMQVVLSRLIRGYEWSLEPGQDLRYGFIPFPRPKSGLKLRVRPRAE